MATLACLLGGVEIQAQLAITEVMSWASIGCPECEESGNHGCRPDFWELTNYGTKTNDLTGYLFADQNVRFPGPGIPWQIPRGVSIRPHESIIFVREGLYLVQDAIAFRQWWGDTNLPTNLQIVCCYSRDLGFDDHGDAVRLFDSTTNLVDEFYFGETRRGFTFVYSTNRTNGGAALQSELGISGAFRAAMCGDVGSPGWAPRDPVPLQITQQPVSQTAEAGSDVTFHVGAIGLPRPRYQWYFNDAPLTNTGKATPVPWLAGFAGCGPAWIKNPEPPDLTLYNVQPNQAGKYFVEVFNGLERLTSTNVLLTVNTKSTPVRLECPPAPLCSLGEGESSAQALVVVTNQRALFTVIARGYPPPSYQWSWSADGTNFVDRPGETNQSFVIQYAKPADAGVYRVRIQNPSGAITADATLVVKRQPRLKITEAMSDECYSEANDWWELTNLDDEPVNLCGFRWDDGPGNIGGGPTVNQSVIVQPGESVIFLEGQTTNSFIQWWGASNLPHGLQFISYTANGLESEGDEINVWNPTAIDDHDTVDTIGFARAWKRGASFWFDTFVCYEDPNAQFPVRIDTQSVTGKCGAFPSVLGCDVGSPGWTRWTPPQLTSIRCEGTNNIKLEWRAQPGSTTMVQCTSKLASPTNWTDLGTFSFASAYCTMNDTNLLGDPQRFYRVSMLSPANCPCPEP